jgi:hypothetical protein
MRARAVWLAVCLGLGLSGPAAAEVRRMEAVGAVAIDSETGGAPRDRALRAAVRDAVVRVVLEFVDTQAVPEPAAGEDPDAWIRPVVGDDPFDYASRFRILDDRGVRPALLTPGASLEYVVVAEVHVDEDRVRDRLRRRGLLAEAVAAPDRIAIRIEAEVESFQAYDELRRALLAQRGVDSATPVELRRGLAILEVTGDRDVDALVSGLMARAPEALQLEPLEVESGRVRLRAAWLEAQELEPLPADG